MGQDRTFILNRRTLVLGGVAVLIPVPAVGADLGLWTAKAPLPIDKFGQHSAVIADKIYVLGGASGHFGQVPRNDMHVYDPAADAWSEAPSMATARGFFATAVIGGKLYAIGGSPNMQERDPGIAIVEIYDPKARSWSRGTDMPTPRADLTAAVINGKLYAIGGTRHVAVEALGTVEEYDAATDTWTRKSDMPTPRLHLSCAVVDDKIIVVGGGPEWPVPSAACEMYDPATDGWTKMADMPTPRVGVWAAALNDKVYVMGGLGWDSVALKTVEEFDPKTNSWRKVADMLTARSLLTAEAIGGQVYAIGGTATDFTTQAAVEAFTP